MTQLGMPLQIDRCPHCGIAQPHIGMFAKTPNKIPRGDGGPTSQWGLYGCYFCGAALLAQGDANSTLANPQIVRIIPEPREAHEDLPERVRNYLNQAYQTLGAPDAAAVMAGSAVDAMLKELGYEDGSVYARIDQAQSAGVLTEGMARWAHSVRLGANRPRHADKDAPHVSPAEARQSVEFAEALGNFLFVLTARINRGIAAAEEAR